MEQQGDHRAEMMAGSSRQINPSLADGVLAKDSSRYGSTRSIFTVRRVRADSIIASVTSTTRSRGLGP